MNALQRSLRVCASAFTLIELLVTISVIGVLIAVLLPILSESRQVAFAVVCKSHLQQTGVALNQYTFDWDDYYPGPNTSGFETRKSEVLQRASESATRPVMKGDWMSPLFGQALTLPTDRNARMVGLFNDEFRCPAINFRYNGIFKDTFGSTVYSSLPGWPPPSTINVNSYSSPIGFHAYDDEAAARQNGPNAEEYGWIMHNDDLGVRTNRVRFRFRITQVGSASRKVFALDGSRYMRQDGVQSFNITDGVKQGDNWISRGPALNPFGDDNGSPYKTVGRDESSLERYARMYTYRHAQDTLNAVFFDGHVQAMTGPESRDPSFYWPTGSRVVERYRVTGGLSNGDIIP